MSMPYTANHPDPLMGAQRRVVLCAGTGCVANGAMKVYAAFQASEHAGAMPALYRRAPRRKR